VLLTAGPGEGFAEGDSVFPEPSTFEIILPPALSHEYVGEEAGGALLNTSWEVNRFQPTGLSLRISQAVGDPSPADRAIAAQLKSAVLKCNRQLSRILW